MLKRKIESQKLAQIILAIGCLLFAANLFLIFFAPNLRIVGLGLMPIAFLNFANWYQIKKASKSQESSDKEDMI
jgi:purine-cytosine permease-like protein